MSSSDSTPGRMSFLMWADALFDGRPPMPRIVYTGQEARDGIYSWIYLRELLAVREVAEDALKLPATSAPRDLLTALDKLRSTKKEAGILGDDILKVFAPMVIAMEAFGKEPVEFCELGSTLFGSVEKMLLNMRLLGAGDDLSGVYFTGLEHSPYLQQVAALLHPECRMAFLDDWKKWQKNPAAQKHLFLSRFVASYAMSDTAALAQWLQPFDVFTVTDVFHLGEGNFQTWDLGLEMTFFDFPKLVESMLSAGFLVFVTDMHPDHHTYKNQDCFVARLFGIKKESAFAFGEKLKAYPQIEEFLQESALNPGDAQMYKTNLATRVTPARWEAIRAYKQEYPVWGETPDPLPVHTGKPRQPAVPGANFTINHPQLADAINQALLRK